MAGDRRRPAAGRRHAGGGLVADGARRSFSDADTEGNGAPFHPDRTVGGRPALWTEQSRTLNIVDIGPFKATVAALRGGRFTVGDAETIGAGITPAGDPTAVDTWAVRAVG
jgi:hypothetical protein